MFGLIFATVSFVVYVLFLRLLTSLKNPRFVVIMPANTTALVITKPNTVVRDNNDNIVKVNDDGGNITHVIHAIPGRKLDKSSSDPMNWRMKKGTEVRGLFFIFGIQFIWFFRYLRINEVRTFRWGREHNQEAYHMMAKSEATRHPHFFGQHDIEQKGVETREVVKFDLRLNVTLEETYPVRVRLLTADPYAVLTMIVNDHVVNEIGAVDPKAFIGESPDEIPTENEREGAKKSLKRRLVESFNNIRERIAKETGITIRNVSLPEFDFDDETRKLLERKTVALLNAEANLITAKNEADQAVARAKGQRDAQFLINEGDANRVTEVITPAAETSDRTSAFNTDRAAAAYVGNQTVTNYAPGIDKMMPVAGK